MRERLDDIDPHLKAILTRDGLTLNAPYIRLVENFRLKYILGAKLGDYEFLFEQLESSEKSVYHEIQTVDGYYHQFRLLKGSIISSRVLLFDNRLKL